MGLVSELLRFARRLRDEPGFSRNRRFDELSSPEALALRGRLRRLEGLARELGTASTVTVERCDDGYRLTLTFAAVRARRETFLTPDEHALLVAEGRLAPPLPIAPW